MDGSQEVFLVDCGASCRPPPAWCCAEGCGLSLGRKKRKMHLSQEKVQETPPFSKKKTYKVLSP